MSMNTTINCFFIVVSMASSLCKGIIFAKHVYGQADEFKADKTSLFCVLAETRLLYFGFKLKAS